MTFFTRPRLNNDQFQQPVADVLTLSGETNFSGILRSKGVEIDGDDASASTGYVLTFNGTKISLQASSASLTYSGNSPTTIGVGGMAKGTTITGRTISDILEEILVPVLDPTFVAPTNTFTDDQNTPQEVGKPVNIAFTATFNRGQINLDGSLQNPRAGLPNQYNYTGSGLSTTVISTALSDNQSIIGYVLSAGTNQWGSSVTYDQGAQPLDSQGNNFGTPLAAGTTSIKNVTIEAIYPYYYGTVQVTGSTPTRPTANQALVTGGTKIVGSSTGTISTSFNSTSNEYIWFAIPSTSTSKTKWFVDALNNGSIGGAVSVGGNLFPNPDTVSITSEDGYWSSINYKVYISNYRTAVNQTMELRNS